MLNQAVIIVISLTFRLANWTRLFLVVWQLVYKNGYYVTLRSIIGPTVVTRLSCVTLYIIWATQT